MSKKDFIGLTGEDPEDMFGPDWENVVEDMPYLEGTMEQLDKLTIEKEE